MKLFNFHTHNPNEDYGIINLFPDASSIEENKLYSIGLHPYYYSENYMQEIEKIQQKAQYPNIVAIGETGFDVKSKVSFEIQKEIFMKHVEISETYKKPLIIHCVKYYNELIEIKKAIKPTQIWVIHGFNAKVGLIKPLFNAGFYFSISVSLLKNQAKSKIFFDIVPCDKIFFETDDFDTFLFV